MLGTFDTLTDLDIQGVIDLNLGTVWNNWNEMWAGTVREINRRTDVSRRGRRMRYQL